MLYYQVASYGRADRNTLAQIWIKPFSIKVHVEGLPLSSGRKKMMKTDYISEMIHQQHNALKHVPVWFE